ncbi:MAG: hypothetical protein ABIW16_00280 [Sphingomicrobium sp.]
MTKLLIALPLLLLAATPAEATGGLICRTSGQRPIEVALVISHTAVSAVVSARLSDNRRDVPVSLAQAWLDQREVRVDLVDKQAMRHELRLRAASKGRGYDGVLWRLGQRRWVRCRES